MPLKVAEVSLAGWDTAGFPASLWLLPAGRHVRRQSRPPRGGGRMPALQLQRLARALTVAKQRCCGSKAEDCEGHGEHELSYR